jgi:hypothetical protein
VTVNRLDYRSVLSILWMAFFVVDLGVLTALYFGDSIGGDSYRAALSQLSSLFVPYLGAILAYHFSTRSATTPTSKRLSLPFGFAVLTALLWNSVLTLQYMNLLLGRGFIETVIEDSRDFGSVLAWFVAPSIGFFFGAAGQTGKTADAKRTP